MAVKKTEVELITPTMFEDAAKGVFVQNMLRNKKGWEVRKGFGQIANLDFTTSLRNSVVASATNAPTGDWQVEQHLGSHLIRTKFGHEQIVSVFLAKIFTGSNNDDVAYDGVVSATTGIGSLGNWIRSYVVSIYDVTTDDWWDELLYKHTTSASRTNVWKEDVIPMWSRKATYESVVFNDYSNFIHGFEDEYFFFEEFDDTLYFGNEKAGVFAYFPSIFRNTRSDLLEARSRRQLDSEVANQCAGTNLGETSMIVPIVHGAGIYHDAYTYLDSTTFPQRISAITNLGRRLIFGAEKTVYIADEGRPTSIMAMNSFFLGSEDNITAMEEFNGKLLIFTKNETYMFQPGGGSGLPAEGSLIKLSSDVGCLNASSIVRWEGGVSWVDVSGIYNSTGGAFTKISENVDGFFRDFMTNPLTSYYEDGSAWADQDYDQPTGLVYALTKSIHGSVNATWDATRRNILYTFPELNISFCWNVDEGFSVWNFESRAPKSTGVIDARTNMRSTWLMAGETELYSAALNPPQLITDFTYDGGVALRTNPGSPSTAARNTRSRSFIVTQYGKGGAIDRSCKNEDTRILNGHYYLLSSGNTGSPGTIAPTNANCATYIEPWISLPAGYTFPTGETLGQGVISVKLSSGGTGYPDSGTIVSFSSPGGGGVTATGSVTVVAGAVTAIAITNAGTKYTSPPTVTITGTGGSGAEGIAVLASDAGFLLPITVRMGHDKPDAADINTGNIPPDVFYIQFSFDNVHWQPIYKSGASTEIDLILPPERAWYAGNMLGKVRKAGGVASRAGNTIRIQYTQATGAGHMNMVARSKQLICYLPMVYSPEGTLASNKTFANVITMGIVGRDDADNYAYTEIGDTSLQLGRIYAWQQATHLNIRNDNDYMAQSVDWAFKSNEVGIKEGVIAKARTLYLSLVSHGKGDDPIVSAGDIGPLNTLLGSDFKEYASQVLDFDGMDDVANLSRITDNTSIRTRLKDSAGTLQNVTFDNTGKYDVDVNGGGDDVVLASNEAYNTISFSDSVKGEMFSWLVYGFMRDRAEKILIDSMKASFVPSGGRRRRGR